MGATQRCALVQLSAAKSDVVIVDDFSFRVRVACGEAQPGQCRELRGSTGEG